MEKTITKIEKRESSSIDVIQENVRFLQMELLASIEVIQEYVLFLQTELLAKNNLIKSLMETQTVALEAITNLKEKPQV